MRSALNDVDRPARQNTRRGLVLPAACALSRPTATDPGLSRIKAWDEALTSIAGVPESQLSRNVAAGLADSAPGPPWDCRVSGVFWSHKAKPGAAEALPEVLRASPRVPVTIGALIRYIDSPRAIPGDHRRTGVRPTAFPPGPCGIHRSRQ